MTILATVGVRRHVTGTARVGVRRRVGVVTVLVAVAMSLFVVGVVAAGAALSSCTDVTWGCETVHDPDPGVAGSNTAIAFDASGEAWVSFRDQDAQALMVARHVGSGGTCAGNAAWECAVVDDAAGHDVGFETDIAFTSDGAAWVSYQDTTSDDLRVAHTCAAAPSGWCVEVVDSTRQVGGYSAIAVENDAPLVTYWDSANDDLRWARRAGGGVSCDAAGWDCGVVDSGTVGAYANDLAVDSVGRAWAAYRYSGSGTGPKAAKLVVAMHVGTGGTGCGRGSSEWTCVPVARTGNVGLDTGIAFDSTGNAWVHYWNSQNLNLARLDPGGTASRCDVAADWSCSTIHDASDSLGEYGAIAFDVEGSPWVVYYGAAATNAYVAHYVGNGAGGGCGAGGSSDWSCSTLDGTGDVGAFWMGIATNPVTGKPWVSYFDRGNGALKVAVLHGTTEPPPPPGPVIDSFSPTSGTVGTQVTVSGSNLGDTTAVAFNGLAVSPDARDVQSGTWVTATVPSGAKTGPITITTPSGPATSTQSFRVTKR
ncbi:MAG TPA: IPT/TIG domain-containing protein [Gaiellaceae bacterium]|nr:IPT/TIG domain-containing protein [Gaiellaceae bacterium]